MADHYSVSDLKAQAQAVIAEARTTKRPVCISQNGHAAVVVVDADTYLNQMQALREFERIYRNESGIRPAPQQNASAPQTSAAMRTWRCKVCGFTVQAEALPEGFVCPTCGVGANVFDVVEG